MVDSGRFLAACLRAGRPDGRSASSSTEQNPGATTAGAGRLGSRRAHAFGCVCAGARRVGLARRLGRVAVNRPSFRKRLPFSRTEFGSTLICIQILPQSAERVQPTQCTVSQHSFRQTARPPDGDKMQQDGMDRCPTPLPRAFSFCPPCCIRPLSRRCFVTMGWPHRSVRASFLSPLCRVHYPCVGPRCGRELARCERSCSSEGPRRRRA